MLSVYRIVVTTTRGEQRGRFKVLVTAREGMYSFTVPQTVLGKMLYKMVKQRPLTIDFGRSNALQLKTEDLNLKGVRPLGKTARKVVKYVPLRQRPPKPKQNKKGSKKGKETTPPQTTPKPENLEITSAVFPETTTTKENTEKNTKKGASKGGRNRSKRAVATAA